MRGCLVALLPTPNFTSRRVPLSTLPAIVDGSASTPTYLPSADRGDVVQGLEHPFLETPPPRGRLGLVEQPEHAEAFFAPSLPSATKHTGGEGVGVAHERAASPSARTLRVLSWP